ncbi:mucin-19-like [Sycon ciliatum]|uniref:mucin-19-like n=1 Tax=Sycon ciliatum TaxID=27933 RepID=UPI0031F6B454
MENGVDLEQLDEVELGQKLDEAGSYEERRKIRAALRRLRKSSANSSSQLEQAPDSSTSADAYTPSPQSTYKRQGYQVQKDPPLHYGVRHWESVSVAPALARRASKSEQGFQAVENPAVVSTARSSKSSSSSADTSRRGKKDIVDDTAEAAQQVEPADAMEQDYGSTQTAARTSSSNDESERTDGGRSNRSAEQPESGAESGYRSESRMSTTSFRSEGGESVHSLDSVQSDLELEETLQKEIEASQDYDERKKLRARLRHVQQRRMSKCQMSTDGRPGSSQEVHEGYSTSSSLTSTSSTGGKGSAGQPTWMGVARRMSNPSLAAAERLRSPSVERPKSVVDDVFKSVSLRKTGQLERKPSLQDGVRSTASTPESPYKGIQLKKTGVLESPAAEPRPRKASAGQSDMPASPYKGVQLKKTGVLEQSESSAQRTSVGQSSTGVEPAYSDVQLKKTGVLEQSESRARKDSVGGSRTGQSDVPASPYKGVQLKKTGVLEQTESRARRTSVGQSSTAVEPAYSDVQLKRTGTLERGRSGSVTRRDSVSSADAQESPYKSVQLRKTGVREAEASPARRMSTSRSASDASVGSPYKSIALRKTGKLEKELVDEPENGTSREAASPVDTTDGVVSNSNPVEPTAQVQAPKPEDTGELIQTGMSSLKKTGVLENRRRWNVADDTPTKPAARADKGASPWSVSLKKVSTPASSTKTAVTPGRKESTSSTVSSTVDYLSVLKKRRAGPEAEEAPKTPSSGSGARQSRSSTSESPGADYLSVLRRRKAGGDGEPPSSRSAIKRTSSSGAESADYAKMRGSLRKADSKIMDAFGRPKSTSQAIDYQAVLNRPAQTTAEQLPTTPTRSYEPGVNGDSSATEGRTNGHSSEEPELSPSSTNRDIVIPGGIHITSDETDV